MIKRLAQKFGYDIHRLDSNKTFGEYVRVMLPGFGVNVVVDVGAHTGEYGRFLRAHGYKGLIVSFEPQAEAFATLETVADGNWRTLRYALGTAEGTASLNVSAATDFSSFHPFNSYGSTAYPAAAMTRTEEVPVRRLDQSLDLPKDARIFLKMDTQGFDMQVFRGAAGILPSVVMVQSEMSARPLYDGAPDFLKSIAEIRDAGFALSGVFPLGRDSEGCLQEFDCLMVRPTDASQDHQ